MRTNYRMNSGVRFQMLSNDQLEELFWGVLRLLEHTGLDVKHAEARDVLEKAGAWVDGERVRISGQKITADGAAQLYPLCSRWQPKT